MPAASNSARRQQSKPRKPTDHAALDIPEALLTLVKHLRSEEQWRLARVSAAQAWSGPHQHKQTQQQPAAHAGQEDAQSPHAPKLQEHHEVLKDQQAADSPPPLPPPLTVPSTAPSARSPSPATRPVISSTAPLSSQASLLNSPAAGSRTPPHQLPPQRSSRSAVESKAPTPPLWEEARRNSPSRPTSRNDGRNAADGSLRSRPARHAQGGVRGGNTGRSKGGRGKSSGAPQTVRLPPSHPLPLKRGALESLGKWLALGAVTLPHIVSVPGMQLYVQHILAPSAQACGVAPQQQPRVSFLQGGGPMPDSKAAGVARSRTLALCLKLLTHVAPFQPATGGAWDSIVQHAHTCAAAEVPFLAFVLKAVAAWSQLKAYSRSATKVFHPPPGHANIVAAMSAMARCVHGCAVLLHRPAALPFAVLPAAAQTAVMQARAGQEQEDPPFTPLQTPSASPEQEAEAYWQHRGGGEGAAPAPLSLADIRGSVGVKHPLSPPQALRARRHSSTGNPTAAQPPRDSSRPSTAGSGRQARGTPPSPPSTITLSLAQLLQLLPCSLATVLAAAVVHVPNTDEQSDIQVQAEHEQLAAQDALLLGVTSNPLLQPALLRWLLTDIGVPLFKVGMYEEHWLFRLLVDSIQHRTEAAPQPLPPSGLPPPKLHHSSHLREIVQHIMFRVPEEQAAGFFGAPLGMGPLTLSGGLVLWATLGATCAQGEEEIHDLGDIADAALGGAPMVLHVPQPESGTEEGCCPLERGVQFTPADLYMGDAYMAVLGAGRAAGAARLALHAAQEAVTAARTAASAGGSKAQVSTGGLRPPAARPPPVKGGSARPGSSARQVRAVHERSAPASKHEAAVAIQAAAAAVAAAVAASDEALRSITQAVAECGSGGSWALDPYWQVTIAHLRQRQAALQAAQGVQAAQAAMQQADAAVLWGVPVLHTLAAHSVLPTQATLGLWQACRQLAPVLGRWRYALTAWGRRRPLVQLWLANANVRAALLET